MTNTKIDIEANADLKDIIGEPGGDVSNEVRVTIREGVTKAEAHKALQAISNALIGDAITLE